MARRRHGAAVALGARAAAGVGVAVGGGLDRVEMSSSSRPPSSASPSAACIRDSNTESDSPGLAPATSIDNVAEPPSSDMRRGRDGGALPVRPSAAAAGVGGGAETPPVEAAAAATGSASPPRARSPPGRSASA